MLVCRGVVSLQRTIPGERCLFGAKQGKMVGWVGIFLVSPDFPGTPWPKNMPEGDKHTTHKNLVYRASKFCKKMSSKNKQLFVGKNNYKHLDVNI